MTKPRKPGALEEAIQHILCGTGNFSMHESDKTMLRILRAAKRDRDRLDWLESCKGTGVLLESASGRWPFWTWDKNDFQKSGRTARDALDAAMRSSGRGK